MSIFQAIETKIKQALLKRDVDQVAILKLLKSSVLLDSKQQNLDLPTDDICLQNIHYQIKKYQQALVIYTKEKQADQIAIKQAEIELLQSLLPPQLDDQQLEKFLDEFLASSSLAPNKANFKQLLEAASTSLSQQVTKGRIAVSLQRRLQ